MTAEPRVAVVFAAAPLRATRRLTARLAALPKPYVVAADGGAGTALAFGYPPDVVVGDLDSVDATTLAELRHRGIPIETYPREKDVTDGQLAIERALQFGPDSLWLLGFLGGPRLDQALANVLLLARMQMQAVLLDEDNECVILRPESPYAWSTEPGEIVSLMPASASVEGVQTEGLRWGLENERLALGDTRGVSNEPKGPGAAVSIASGLLLLTRHFPAIPDPWRTGARL